MKGVGKSRIVANFGFTGTNEPKLIDKDIDRFRNWVPPRNPRSTTAAGTTYNCKCWFCITAIFGQSPVTESVVLPPLNGATSNEDFREVPF